MPASTRRLVGWLLVVAGILLALGQLIRLGVAAYSWSAANTEVLALGLLLINMLGLVAAGLLVRYGRRLLRGGEISDGPASKTIL
jgi:hypothetical protein